MYVDTQAAYVCFGVLCCLTPLPWGSVPVSSIDRLFISLSLVASALFICWVLNMADTLYSATHMYLDSEGYYCVDSVL